mgnify:CR=1 FL=1
MRKLSFLLLFSLWFLTTKLIAQTDTIYPSGIDRYSRNIIPLADSTFLIQDTEMGNFYTCNFKKADKNGNILSTFTFGSPDSIQYLAYDILKVDESRLVITGDYQSPAIPLSMDSYIQLIDTAGNEIWKTDFGFSALVGGGKDKGEIVAKLENKYVVAGRTKDYYTGGSNFNSPSFWNSFLALFDTSGTLLRQESVGHIVDTTISYWTGFVYGMETISNKVYLLHHLTSSVPWKKESNLVILDDSLQLLDTIPLSNESYTNLFALSGSTLLLSSKDSLIKTDANGTILWKKSFPVSSHIKSLQKTGNQQLLLQCSKTYVSSFEPACFLYSQDTITIYRTDSNFTSFTFIATYIDTLSGTIHSSKGVVGSDQGYAFAGDQDCNPWFVYLPPSAFTSINETPDINPIRVYPNPVNEILYVSEIPDQSSAAYIYSLDGKLIHEIRLSAISDGIDIRDLMPGYYFLMIQSSSGNYSSGFIKANP